MNKSTDKAPSNADGPSSSSPDSAGTVSARKRDDQHFWRALKKDDEIQTLHKTVEPPLPDKPVSQSPQHVDLTADINDLSNEDRENRRQALRSMLEVSEARQQGAIRARKPIPEAGLRVGVRNGPFKGREGTILDADYIQSRVLLDMEDGRDAQWIEFSRLQSLISD